MKSKGNTYTRNGVGALRLFVPISSESEAPSASGEPIPAVEDYERLVQSLSYCILIHDAVSKDILWANQAACNMLGFTLEELKPLKAPDMSSADSRFRRSV